MLIGDPLWSSSSAENRAHRLAQWEQQQKKKSLAVKEEEEAAAAVVEEEEEDEGMGITEKEKEGLSQSDRDILSIASKHQPSTTTASPTNSTTSFVSLGLRNKPEVSWIALRYFTLNCLQRDRSQLIVNPHTTSEFMMQQTALSVNAVLGAKSLVVYGYLLSEYRYDPLLVETGKSKERSEKCDHAFHTFSYLARIMQIAATQQLSSAHDEKEEETYTPEMKLYAWIARMELVPLPQLFVSANYSSFAELFVLLESLVHGLMAETTEITFAPVLLTRWYFHLHQALHQRNTDKRENRQVILNVLRQEVKRRLEAKAYVSLRVLTLIVFGPMLLKSNELKSDIDITQPLVDYPREEVTVENAHRSILHKILLPCLSFFRSSTMSVNPLRDLDELREWISDFPDESKTLLFNWFVHEEEEDPISEKWLTLVVQYMVVLNDRNGWWDILQQDESFHRFLRRLFGPTFQQQGGKAVVSRFLARLFFADLPHPWKWLQSFLENFREVHKSLIFDMKEGLLPALDKVTLPDDLEDNRSSEIYQKKAQMWLIDHFRVMCKDCAEEFAALRDDHQPTFSLQLNGFTYFRIGLGMLLTEWFQYPWKPFAGCLKRALSLPCTNPGFTVDPLFLEPCWPDILQMREEDLCYVVDTFHSITMDEPGWTETTDRIFTFSTNLSASIWMLIAHRMITLPSSIELQSRLPAVIHHLTTEIQMEGFLSPINLFYHYPTSFLRLLLLPMSSFPEKESFINVVFGRAGTVYGQSPIILFGFVGTILHTVKDLAGSARTRLNQARKQLVSRFRPLLKLFMVHHHGYWTSSSEFHPSQVLAELVHFLMEELWKICPNGELCVKAIRDVIWGDGSSPPAGIQLHSMEELFLRKTNGVFGWFDEEKWVRWLLVNEIETLTTKPATTNGLGLEFALISFLVERRLGLSPGKEWSEYYEHYYKIALSEPYQPMYGYQVSRWLVGMQRLGVEVEDLPELTYFWAREWISPFCELKETPTTIVRLMKDPETAAREKENDAIAVTTPEEDRLEMITDLTRIEARLRKKQVKPDPCRVTMNDILEYRDFRRMNADMRMEVSLEEKENEWELSQEELSKAMVKYIEGQLALQTTKSQANLLLEAKEHSYEEFMSSGRSAVLKLGWRG
jgi:hypothetical protein